MSFTFQNKEFEPFDHEYNRTAVNERRAEVPIIRWYIEKRLAGLRLFEVGNVLSNYQDISWDVVDKEEEGAGIITKDIKDFKPKKKYEALVSISTFEHFGGTELTEEIIKNLQENCLVPDAPMVITIPIGYNRELEKFILDKKSPFDRWYWMTRDAENNWRESHFEESKDAEYDKPYGAAGVIMIATSNL